MKNVKRIMIISICSVMMLIAFTACSSQPAEEVAEEITTEETTETEMETESETEELTPIDVLNDDEKSIYEAVINAGFYNPSVARVVRGAYDKNAGSWAIVIQGTNKVGGVIMQQYYVKSGYLEDFGDLEYEPSFWTIWEDVVKEDGEELVLNDTQISEINTAIAYYWESKGL